MATRYKDPNRRPVALTVRAPDSKSGGWGFESLLACQGYQGVSRNRLLLFVFLGKFCHNFAKNGFSPLLLLLPFSFQVDGVQDGAVLHSPHVFNVLAVYSDDHFRVPMSHYFCDPQRVFSQTQGQSCKGVTGLLHLPEGQSGSLQGWYPDVSSQIAAMHRPAARGAEEILAVEAIADISLFIDRLTHCRCESYGSPAISVLCDAFDALAVYINRNCPPYVQQPSFPVYILRLEPNLLTRPESRSEGEVKVRPPM